MNSQREAFEKVFSLPTMLIYNEKEDEYRPINEGPTWEVTSADFYNCYYDGWKKAWNTRQAATEQGVGEAVYQWREIGETDWMDCSKEWKEKCDESPEHDARTLYTHPPKPTECYTKQDCQEEFKRGFNDGWSYGRFMLEVDQAAEPTGGGVPALPEDFIQSVKRLAFSARTSGGTAGRDADLCRQLDRVEAMLEAMSDPDWPRAETQHDDLLPRIKNLLLALGHQGTVLDPNQPPYDVGEWGIKEAQELYDLLATQQPPEQE